MHAYIRIIQECFSRISLQRLVRLHRIHKEQYITLELVTLGLLLTLSLKGGWSNYLKLGSKELCQKAFFKIAVT